ncbi:UDP-4-amino-4,6-dideoxy-N-acetyl-beta-L-altrosamine transaminase [Alphaproteobacteria bacterium]|nr:UDP-4-amino-4,6-dideoxy-N-acetyl-beta-L-altrosamine transaminase [Alphaproteobacteria bacterium]
MKKNVLITGGSGLLATNWALAIKDNFSTTLLFHKKRISIQNVETDVVFLNSLDQCFTALRKHQPDILINTAGLTNVEECEANPRLARETNVDLAKNLAIACNQQNVKLVHISTDHLFDGNKEFSTEESIAYPLNTYAETKLLGEQKVLENCKDALIIRSNFFCWGTKYRQSFSDFILDNLRKNKPIYLFTDVFFSPIFAIELFNLIHQLIDINSIGIFNVVSNERISKYEFGIKLANCFNLDIGLIKRVSIKDNLKLVNRPMDMSLSNFKVCQTLNCEVISLKEQFKNLKELESIGAFNKVVMNIIPYGKHYIDEEDIQSVVDVLRHGMLTQGPKVAEFEKKIANYVGAKYAVAVSNGTAALHLACMALELSQGDSVITTPNTFVATSNSVLYVGAKPVFVDIDLQTLNIDIGKIEEIIETSNNIKALFPVHFAGLPCDMEKIKQLADKYGLAVVEDGSHALGSIYDDGKKVGNCQYSDMTTFSFHPVKGIASGEGGIITTNNSHTYNKLNLLRSHGITKGNFEFPGISLVDNSLINKNEGIENGELKRWYYEMQYLGYNYRITDIQCALACSQMDKIDVFLARRKQLVKQYDKAFKDYSNIKLFQLQGRELSSHHIYIISIDFETVGLSRHQFMQELAKKGVGSQVHYIPVVSQPYYQKMDYSIDNYPVVSVYYQNTLSIPLYYGLSDAEQELVIESIIHLL